MGLINYKILSNDINFPTEINTADRLTRGIHFQQFVESSLLRKGPTWLP